MSCCLVTGGAGFIGNHLVRALLQKGHDVRVIDDLSTGNLDNLADVRERITFFLGSICDTELVTRASRGVTCCYHQAALPSVPRSVKDPWRSNRVNVEGTLNVFLAARDAGVKRVVFASSSSVYGNTDVVPTHEGLPLAPISPYGVTKATCEMYARAFTDLYGMDIVALRYFNVFGPRQNPQSQYAAVIPIFVQKMLAGERPPVDGDGMQSRDFSYIDNVVSANIKAGEAAGSIAGVYNVACGESTTVLDLVNTLNAILGLNLAPDFQAARAGDIRRSCAAIGQARAAFGYEPLVGVREGLERTVRWFQGGPA